MSLYHILLNDRVAVTRPESPYWGQTGIVKSRNVISRRLGILFDFSPMKHKYVAPASEFLRYLPVEDVALED